MEPPLHPGDFVREDVVAPLAISVAEAARRAGVEPGYLEDLLACRVAVNLEAAAGLAALAGNSVGFWMGLQAEYDRANPPGP